jgi:predicted nucleic acid-binding protein
MKIIISNATPLINFSAIERLDILRQLFGTVVIPQAVYDETTEGEFGGSNAITTAIAEQWLVIEVVHKDLFDINLQLDRGEKEVIALGLTKSRPLLLLDEREARHYAKKLNLSVLGTLGILLLAKQNQIISLVQPFLDQMIDKAQYWVNHKLYLQVLKQAEEIDHSLENQ